MSNQAIAARLFVTDRTVEAHISANLASRPTSAVVC
jgi:DNA-binding NarL/FixJ family response regulator